jgi:hypothetical protein
VEVEVEVEVGGVCEVCGKRVLEVKVSEQILRIEQTSRPHSHLRSLSGAESHKQMSRNIVTW